MAVAVKAQVLLPVAGVEAAVVLAVSLIAVAVVVGLECQQLPVRPIIICTCCQAVEVLKLCIQARSPWGMRVGSSLLPWVVVQILLTCVCIYRADAEAHAGSVYLYICVHKNQCTEQEPTLCSPAANPARSITDRHARAIGTMINFISLLLCAL